MDNITIRLAVPDDAPNMADVHMRSWEVAYKDIIPAAFIKEKNTGRHELYKRVITNDNTNTYVIQHCGKIIGIMRVAPPIDDDASEDWYELHFIYLHPDYYRQGIGTRAMEFAFDIAQNLGKKIMVVWVLEDNINSVKFYEKCGFTADGKTSEREFGKILKSARMRRVL